MGWCEADGYAWAQLSTHDDPRLLEAEVAFYGLRALRSLEQRVALNKPTVYVSERWFKPPIGFLCVLVPSYFRMARRMVKVLFDHACVSYYAMGIHAARDMLRLAGLFKGDIRCLFRAPKVAFESKPGGVIVPLREAIRAGVLPDEAVRFAKRHGFVQIPEAQWGVCSPKGLFAKVKLWGYFVVSGRGVGKRTADLVRACRPNKYLKRTAVSLHLYGGGPEEKRVRRLAQTADNVQLHGFVPVERVRDLM